MHVLVTGGLGFIGGHLVDEFVRRGHRVRVLDDASTGRAENGNLAAELVLGDIRDARQVDEACDGIDAVAHLAGQASTIKSFHDPHADLEANVGGTLNLISAVLHHRVSRVLYASSMAVYGYPEEVPTPETSICQPAAYYGITKLAAERYLHVLAERSDIDHAPKVTSFRMFNVFGERQNLNNPYHGPIATFIGNVLAGRPIEIHGDGEQSRDFVHVSDVTHAWADALDAPASHNQVLNIGAGGSRSINHIVDTILAALGHTRQSYDVRYGTRRPGDQDVMQADISKIRRVLGWEPKVDFDDGLRRTVEWAREQAGRTVPST